MHAYREHQDTTPFELKGRIGGEHIVALIDGGVTHNFVDQCVVARFRLKTKEFAYKQVCQLQVILDGHAITHDFYVIPLGGAHFVLDVQ